MYHLGLSVVLLLCGFQTIPQFGYAQEGKSFYKTVLQIGCTVSQLGCTVSNRYMIRWKCLYAHCAVRCVTVSVSMLKLVASDADWG